MSSTNDTISSLKSSKLDIFLDRPLCPKMHILSTFDTSEHIKCTCWSSGTVTTARPTSDVCALGISARYFVSSYQDGPLKEGVFDENTGFDDRLSPKKCNSLPAEFVELEGPSVVYNFMQESAWTVWKRLAAGLVFESPSMIPIPSSRFHRLLSELVSNIRSRLFQTENAMSICFYFDLKLSAVNKGINSSIGAE